LTRLGAFPDNPAASFQLFQDRRPRSIRVSASLRKAIARRLAENGATQKMIRSAGGWTNDREVAIYTAGADQASWQRPHLPPWRNGNCELAQTITKANSQLAHRLRYST
jgi:hypothetical protein